MTQIHPLTVLAYSTTAELIGVGSILLLDPANVRYYHIAELIGHSGIFLWGIWMAVCGIILFSAYTRQQSVARPTRALMLAGSAAGITFTFLIVGFALEARGLHSSHAWHFPAAFAAYYLASCGCPVLSATRMCQSVKDRYGPKRRVPSE